MGTASNSFLGGTEINGVPAIQWVAISPMNMQYRISLHTVQDPDNDRVGDLPNLISLDPADEAYVGEGRELGVSEDAEEAISLAEHRADARPDTRPQGGAPGRGPARRSGLPTGAASGRTPAPHRSTAAG